MSLSVSDVALRVLPAVDIAGTMSWVAAPLAQSSQPRPQLHSGAARPRMGCPSKFAVLAPQGDALGEQPGGVFPGTPHRGERLLDTVAGPSVGHGDGGDEADQRAHEGVQDPVRDQSAGLIEAPVRV